jgi:hypothetical protein
METNTPYQANNPFKNTNDGIAKMIFLNAWRVGAIFLKTYWLLDQ